MPSGSQPIAAFPAFRVCSVASQWQAVSASMAKTHPAFKFTRPVSTKSEECFEASAPRLVPSISMKVGVLSWRELGTKTFWKRAQVVENYSLGGHFQVLEGLEVFCGSEVTCNRFPSLHPRMTRVSSGVATLLTKKVTWWPLHFLNDSAENNSIDTKNIVRIVP